MSEFLEEIKQRIGVCDANQARADARALLILIASKDAEIEGLKARQSGENRAYQNYIDATMKERDEAIIAQLAAEAALSTQSQSVWEEAAKMADRRSHCGDCMKRFADELRYRASTTVLADRDAGGESLLRTGN